MKRFTAFLLAALLVLSLCACGSSEAPTETEAPVTETPEVTPSEAPAPTAAAVAAVVTLTDADKTGFNLPEDKICVLDAEGMKILISFSDDVSAVTLREIVYDDDFNFVATGNIYAAFGNLAANEAVGLRVFIPDVLPNVALCYQDALGQHCYGIFQSGEDGSLLLTDLRTAEGFNAEGSSD